MALECHRLGSYSGATFALCSNEKWVTGGNAVFSTVGQSTPGKYLYVNYLMELQTLNRPLKMFPVNL